MKKRIWSLALCLCLILTLLPTAALAENASAVIVGGVTLNSTTPYWKNGDTTENRSGSATDWNAKLTFVTGSKATLTLKNAVISGTDVTVENVTNNYGIKAAGDLTIVLEGASSVTGGTATTGSYGIYAVGALTIEGEGSLTVTGGTPGPQKNSFGINVAGALTISGSAAVTATGGTAGSSSSFGVAGNTVTFGGNATVTATGGTASRSSFGVHGGTSVTVSDNATVTVTGGATINGTSFGVYGVTVTVSDNATVTATGGTASSNSSGVSSDTVTIGGSGNVTAVGGRGVNGSYGLSSPIGAITIEDSATVTAVGGEVTGGDSYGVFYNSSDIIYNGGLLVAKGGTTALNKAATGSGAANVISKKADGATASAWNDKYIVYGDAAVYHVYAENIDNTDTDKAGVAWSGSDLTLTNTVIIGADADSTSALTIPDGGTLTLSGFNVALAGDAASANAYGVNGAGDLTIDGGGTLVAIGGAAATTSAGIYGNHVNLSGGRGVAVAGSATTAQAMSVEPTCSNDYKTTTGAWDGKTYTWSTAPVMEVDLDGASGPNAPVRYTDFETGWNAAVGEGNRPDTTVKLLGNWTAAEVANSDPRTTSFGTGDGFDGGSIRVPVGKHISLDLNGKTIDRGLSSATVLPGKGCVIRVGVHGDPYNNTSLTLLDSGTGGTVTGGYDGAAGGVIVNSGTFTMNSGRITGNRGSDDSDLTSRLGSGVFAGHAVFTMKGGEISGNTYGAGVYLSGTSFYVSGAAKVTGNSWDDGTTARNVYLSETSIANSLVISVTGELQDGAAIGVTARTTPTDDASVTVAEGGGTPSHTIDADDAEYFTSDNTTYGVGFDSEDSKLKLSTAYTVTYNSNGGSEIADNNGDHSYTIFTVGFDLPDVPTKSGYTFKGWKVTVGASSVRGFEQGTQYPDAVNLISLTKATGDVTLTAQWTPNGGGGAATYPVTLPATVEGGTVSVSPKNASAGTTVTITPKPNDGKLVDKVTVTDNKGNEVPVTENADGTYSFRQPSGGAKVSVSFKDKAWANPFTDVKESDWFYGDVQYVFEQGLMKGTSDTTFSPNTTTTRGMIVTILYRLAGEPGTTGACPFDDVSTGSYYEKAITWAAANGIVDGYGNDKFGPDDSITREQMATILYRFAEYMKYDTAQGGMAIREYNDYESVSSYATESMAWAVDASLLQGDNNNLMPQSNAVRAQTAAMLHRFCENIVKA